MKIRIALLLLSAVVVRGAEDSENVCRTHLRHLGGALKAYKLLHEDKAPTKLSELYLEGLTDSLGDFNCPASGTTIATAAEIDAKSDYEPGSGDILVREKLAHHGDKPLAILADGSIKPIDSTKTAETAPAKPAANAAAVPAVTETTPPVPAPAPPPTPPAAPETATNAESLPEFSLIPPGTKLPPQKPPPPAPALGLGTRETAYFGANLRDTGTADFGAVIVQVLPRSPAERSGFKEGDVIITVDGQTIQTSRQFVEAVAGITPGARVNMLAVRKGKNLKFTVILGSQPPR